MGLQVQELTIASVVLFERVRAGFHYPEGQKTQDVSVVFRRLLCTGAPLQAEAHARERAAVGSGELRAGGRIPVILVSELLPSPPDFSGASPKNGTEKTGPEPSKRFQASPSSDFWSLCSV